MNHSKLNVRNLILITMGMVFAGCAYGGTEAADDSAETGSVDQAATWGVGPYKTPKKKTVEPGDTVSIRSGSCSVTVALSDLGATGDPEQVAALRCVAEVTASECEGGTRTLDGIRVMVADCERDGSAYECESDVVIECVFKANAG